MGKKGKFEGIEKCSSEREGGKGGPEGKEGLAGEGS